MADFVAKGGRGRVGGRVSRLLHTDSIRYLVLRVLLYSETAAHVVSMCTSSQLPPAMMQIEQNELPTAVYVHILN